MRSVYFFCLVGARGSAPLVNAFDRFGRVDRVLAAIDTWVDGSSRDRDCEDEDNCRESNGLKEHGWLCACVCVFLDVE